MNPPSRSRSTSHHSGSSKSDQSSASNGPGPIRTLPRRSPRFSPTSSTTNLADVSTTFSRTGNRPAQPSTDHQNSPAILDEPSTHSRNSVQLRSQEIPPASAVPNFFLDESHGHVAVLESGSHEGAPADGYTVLQQALQHEPDLWRNARFQLLGRGMNKTVYVLDSNHDSNKNLEKGAFGWVALVSAAGSEGANWRSQKAELDALAVLEKAGVNVPLFVPNLLDCTFRGKPARAFVQERLENMTERGKGDGRALLDAIAKVALSKGRLNKNENTLQIQEDVRNLWRYLKSNDIPDL